MDIISSNVRLKATIAFQVTDSKLCKPKTKCEEPESKAMSTINRSSYTGLVPGPNEICYDDHMLRLGVLMVY